MKDELRAPETRGVTVELLATVDLGPEIEGMAGRVLRMRRVTSSPVHPSRASAPGVGTMLSRRSATEWSR